MAVIKRPGKPSRKTAGKVGDIYIDILTKTKYKCTFAYSAHGKTGDYDWRPLEDEVAEEEEVVESVVETPVVEEVKEEAIESVEEVPVEEAKPKSSKKSNRTNYRAQYNKKSE